MGNLGADTEINMEALLFDDDFQLNSADFELDPAWADTSSGWSDNSENEEWKGISNDFEEEEEWVVSILKNQIKRVTNVNSSWNIRKKGIDWCFCLGEVEKNGLDFTTACEMLRFRPYVLQARIQFQLYLNNVPLRESLPFMAVGLHDNICSEVIIAAWHEGLEIAKILWKWPGMRSDLLKMAVPKMSDDNYYYALGLKNGFWYFTSRSLSTWQRPGFSWSRSFVAD
jgi:hypothetical protein